MGRIRNKQIQKIEIRRKKVVKMRPSEFVRALIGNAFAKINRRGKLLIFHLERGGKFMLVHLKMTGQLIYESERAIVGGGHPWPPLRQAQGKPNLPNAYTRVVFSFADGSKLFFNDLRVFGFMKLVDEEELARVLAAYGIEPLLKTFVWENFRALFTKRSVSLKAVLLDQQAIAGLGNIYADEAAFAARLRPDRRVATLTVAELKRLFRVIPKVLKAAIAHGGTTFENFRDVEGKRGNYMRHLKVYGRAGLKCRRCGATLRRTVVAQRGTVYCPICQR